MTSITGADLGIVTRRSQRLAVLPAALGVAAVACVAITARLSGLLDGSDLAVGLVAVAAAGVGATVLSGHPVGLYGGLAALTLSALTLGANPPAGQVIAVVAGLVAVHEFGRLSLDARRPARFGPGIWRRLIVRAVAIATAGVVAVIAAPWLAGRSLAPLYVPLGLLAAGLPLFARRLSAGPPGGRPARLGPPVVRLAIGSAIAAVAIVGALAGASARSEIETTTPEPTVVVEPVEPTAEPLLEPPSPTGSRGLSVALFALALVGLGLIVLLFKGREPTFELDELHLDTDETRLGLARPGQADTDDSQVEIDEREVAALLDELALDIAGEADPGRAIRYAYANVERRLEAASIVRGPAETEQELLGRALPSLGARGGALVELTALFEHARFGHRPVTEDMRTTALAAVADLRASLTPAIEPADDGGHR